ncbi:MAG TPA: DUF3822 family protein [Cyclobacteriaceae bacterium]|nr:DUF3822 family protein [Cyclobacteriaceae bacterium]HRK55052.1 DUF3822 family protein [Cyclobacteriaceae bacterium]
MAAAAQSYKLIKKIKDEKFDVEHLHEYSLLIQLGVRDLQIGIVDGQDRLVFFEDYIFHNLNSSDDQLELLKELFEAHHLLTAGFWKKVKFSIKNNKLVQVPSSLFVEDAAPEYLKLNAKFDPKKEVVLYCENIKSNVVTVFAVHKGIHQWISILYENSTVSFIHQSAGLIEGVLRETITDNKPPLFIYIDRFKLHILSVNEGRLIYYNQFSIQHFSDYVKYIMLVLNAMEMDQQNSKIVLWGYIGKNSPHAIEFSKYIKNVSFGSRPRHLKYGYLFDEVQDHHFYDLYSLHLLSN